MNERTLFQKRTRRLARSCWSSIGHKKLHIEVEENSLPSPLSFLKTRRRPYHHEAPYPRNKLPVEEIIPFTDSLRVIICSDAFYPVVSPE